VFVIDWTAIGAPPPIDIPPTMTGRVSRRKVMLPSLTLAAAVTAPNA
jgi:hypothetical protein